MTKYSGTVVKDKVAVHSTPSQGGGNKIGNPLKIGTAITGDDLKNGWMQITSPIAGWVQETDVELTDLDTVQTTSTVNQPATNPTTNIAPTASGNLPAVNLSQKNIFRLKRWDELDPKANDKFSSDREKGGDQFSFYTPYITDAAGIWCGDWSSNNNHYTLTKADVLKIEAMQIPDECTVKAKMGWLIWQNNAWGAPMRSDGDWREGEEEKAAEIISAFYAGQMVEVLERRTIKKIDFQGKKSDIPMSRIRTFSRADFGKTFATHPHLVHKVTAVNNKNKHREKVRGTVYVPVALGPEFDFAGKFQPAQWWLMDRWIAYDDPAS